MTHLDYLTSQIEDLDRAIDRLEDSAMTAQEERALRRLVELRDRMLAASDLVDIGRVEPRG